MNLKNKVSYLAKLSAKLNVRKKKLRESLFNMSRTQQGKYFKRDAQRIMSLKEEICCLKNEIANCNIIYWSKLHSRKDNTYITWIKTYSLAFRLFSK